MGMMRNAEIGICIFNVFALTAGTLYYTLHSNSKAKQATQNLTEQKAHYMPGDKIESLGYEIRPYTAEGDIIYFNRPDTLPVVNGDVFEKPKAYELIKRDGSSEARTIVKGNVYLGAKGEQVVKLHEQLTKVAKQLAKIK